MHNEYIYRHVYISSGSIFTGGVYIISRLTVYKLTLGKE